MVKCEDCTKIRGKPVYMKKVSRTWDDDYSHYTLRYECRWCGEVVEKRHVEKDSPVRDHE